MSKKQSTDGSLLPLSLPSLRNNIWLWSPSLLPFRSGSSDFFLFLRLKLKLKG
jgi:hypothetical protein